MYIDIYSFMYAQVRIYIHGQAGGDGAAAASGGLAVVKQLIRIPMLNCAYNFCFFTDKQVAMELLQLVEALQ
jgi:hypothetical protein